MSRTTNSERKAFRGKVSPAARAGDPYLLLPFEVPPGTKAVEVHYDYGGDGNVVDLGIFDSRGCEFLTAEGFRGWSGSARKEVVVGESWATPGYIPGPIYAGTWHVILGFYKVSPRGCSYEVTVHLHRDPVEPPAGYPPATRGPKAYPGESAEIPGWLKGDLHCHTHHSEAQGSVENIAHAAKQKGLNFLSITDHNTVSHWREMEELGETDLVLIPGEEITTYRGHANVWGKGRWLDFRCRTASDVEAVYRVAAAEGRPFSVNHPKPGGPPWEFGFDVPFDCLEVWHGLWSMGNDRSLKLWDSLLKHGRRVIAVGGSDTHPRFRSDGTLTEWIGYPTTWVYAPEPTPEAVLEGIRNGHVVISVCLAGPFLSLELCFDGEAFRPGMRAPPLGKGELEVAVYGGEGLDLVVITANGALMRKRVVCEQWRKEIRVDMEREGFVRAELRVPVPGNGSGPVAAIANPIWCGSFLPGKISHSRRRK